MRNIQATRNIAAEVANQVAPQVLVTVMLLWALVPGNPYGYYLLLRWICCGVFGYLAIQAFESNRQGWVWAMGITAGVYNPIIPVHLTREIWVVVNLVTIGIVGASILALNLSDEQRQLH